MSDYDERYETDRSEDEEEEDVVEVVRHKRRLGEAKRWIRTLVEERNGSLDEGEKKFRFTETDVDRFFEEYPDLTQRFNENTPTLLHAMVDLVHSDEGVSIDSITIKALVRRLVQKFTRLLCIPNYEQQNPLYLAITKKKRYLVDYMVVNCPQEKNARRDLASALEDTRGNEKKKNCLHLAFEKDMRPTTLIRMLEDANAATLAAVDITGRRPMHYAVQYKQCNVELISAFIARDKELVDAQKKSSPHQPPKTFLDVDSEVKTSVYQEHIDSAPVFNGDSRSKKDLAGKSKNAEKPLAIPSDERSRYSGLQRDAAARGRNATIQGKPDDTDPFRIPRSRPQDGRRPNEDERERQESKKRISTRQAVEHGHVDRARRHESQERYRDISRDRQSVGNESSHEPLRIHTDIRSADVVKTNSENAANTPKTLKRVPTMRGDGMGDKSEGRNKQTAHFSKKPPKPVDHEAAARTSKEVLRMLKLHYMRTRSIKRATSWLYKTNPQDVQIFFDYDKLPTQIKKDIIEGAFRATKFDEVLKFVHFPYVTVIRPQGPKSKKGGLALNGGYGRRDMDFFFNFLYEKGVRHILKVVVQEGGQSVHSDEAIKTSLDRITVEHLDWQKVDLDPELICGISSQADHDMSEKTRHGLAAGSKNQLKQLDLRWSGNNAVLRAWSEREGLPSLQHLETVNIIVPEDTVLCDSPHWISAKKDEFEKRLNKNIASMASEKEDEQSKAGSSPRKITVTLHGVHSGPGKRTGVGLLQSGQAQGLLTQTASQKIINTHEWLKCMDAFAKNIKPLWSSTLESFMSTTGAARPDEDGAMRLGLESDVVVALIDDGVALLDQNFVGRVLEGKTFDYQDGEDEPYSYGDGRVGQSYNSAQGHGTEMASCILRACPMAKIYPIRLKTHLSMDGNSEIDLESAALAINAALEKNATIISMSWTIPIPKEPSPEKEMFEAAVRKAANRNDVLMFCSSPDEGHVTSSNYPSAVQRDKVFRIGAAHDDGLAFRLVGKDVDFIFPGVGVNVNPTSAGTGSSVATALAAGLAATIIYCFKISVLAVKAQNYTMGYNEMTNSTFNESTVRKLSRHTAMKAAFNRLGHVNDASFIQIWDTLQSAAEDLEEHDTDDAIVKAQFVIKLCSKLMPPEVL